MNSFPVEEKIKVTFQSYTASIRTQEINYFIHSDIISVTGSLDMFKTHRIKKGKEEKK